MDANGNTLTLNNTPTTSYPDLLAPGAVKTYLASYTIAQNALDNGGVRNSALVRASNVAGTIYVEDISDDGIDADGNTVTDTTDTLITPNPSLNLTKTYVNNDNDGDGTISAGDNIVYTFSLLNDGNVTQRFIYITDYITDFNGNVLELDNFTSPNNLNFISASQGSPNGTLISGKSLPILLPIQFKMRIPQVVVFQIPPQPRVTFILVVIHKLMQ